MSVRRRLDIMRENDPKFLLPKFVEMINQVVERFLPEVGAADGRVKSTFNPRTVRAYQNKGIIDAPFKDGKHARYGYRHFLQALLVRRLLAEGIRAPRIRAVLEGKTDAEYVDLLEGKTVPCGPQAGGGGTRGPWARLEVAPGFEIHLARGFKMPATEEGRKALLGKLRKALRGEMQIRRKMAKRKQARAQ